MEFKIGDSITEEKKEKKKRNLPMIMVVVTAILVGLFVFFISYRILQIKNKKEEPTSQELSLEDQNVKILYQYVNYGNNNKFVKEKKVTEDSFTNQEKFNYAFQFVQPSDITYTNINDEENRKIYFISAEKIEEYMTRFFGEKTSYYLFTKVKTTFPFQVNNKNMAELSYEPEKAGCNIVFTGFEDKNENNLVEPYYKTLVKATKEIDNSISLEEKIIYTKIEEKEGTYTLYIYRDYENKEILEMKQNITKEELEQNPITIDSYLTKASTITYQFKVDKNQYYFESSSMIG